jgi:hypothetical protein
MSVWMRILRQQCIRWPHSGNGYKMSVPLQHRKMTSYGGSSLFREYMLRLFTLAQNRIATSTNLLVPEQGWMAP